MNFLLKLWPDTFVSIKNEHPLVSDRQVAQSLIPPLLEVLLWEELMRIGLPTQATPSTPERVIKVSSASRSDEEIAARSSWGELLHAEASLSNLKRLLIKEVIPQHDDLTDEQTEELAEQSWGELLNSDVSAKSLRALFTREIRLFD